VKAFMVLRMVVATRCNGVRWEAEGVNGEIIWERGKNAPQSWIGEPRN
jgi:hypothetical protein